MRPEEIMEARLDGPEGVYADRELERIHRILRQEWQPGTAVEIDLDLLISRTQARYIEECLNGEGWWTVLTQRQFFWWTRLRLRVSTPVAFNLRQFPTFR